MPVFCLPHSGYEGIQIAESDTPSCNSSARVEQQQQEVIKLTNLLSAIKTLAQHAAKSSASDPAGLIKAAESNSPEPKTGASTDVYVSDSQQC
jgi:hypothetical protein